MQLVNPTLFVASIVAFVAGSVYVFVSNEFRRRVAATSVESSRALLFFSLWWLALGVNILIGGTFYLAASFDLTSFALYLVYANVQRLLLAISLVGLMYYLLYLLTGRSWLGVIVPFYAVYFLLLIYSTYAGQPRGVYVGSWRADLEYTRETGSVFQLVGGAMLILPPVVSSLVYFFRFFRASADRTQRFRIALVSWSLIVWWAMAVVAGQRESFGNEEFQLINRFTGLAAALVILLAYRPPAAIRRWLAGASEPAPVEA